MKHDYDAPSGLFHEKPSSKTSEARTTFLSDLLEWCEWDITIPSRIEHFPSPSTSPFECTWDPNCRHWKKQTSEWKVLPSHLSSQSTSLLNSGAYCNYRARKHGSVDDQFTSRCRSHNKNSFWLESNIYNVQSHQGWSKHWKSHHWWEDGTKSLCRFEQ